MVAIIPIGASPNDNQGIAAILSDAIDLEHGLVNTGIPNLCLLPAGNLDPARRHVAARSETLKKIVIAIERHSSTH